MIGTIVWLIGLVCAIWCVLDIFKKNISTGGKVIAAVVVLLTSCAVPIGFPREAHAISTNIRT